MNGDVLPDPDSEFGIRVRSRLQAEDVMWMTTVGRDGTPQPNPVWCVLHDPSTLLVYTRPDALRLTHVKERPRVAFNFNTGVDGNDVIVITGDAEIAPELPGPHEHEAYLAKYGAAMSGVSGSLEAFAADYSVPLVVHIRRVRGF